MHPAGTVVVVAATLLGSSVAGAVDVVACELDKLSAPDADELEPAMVKGRDTAVGAYRFPRRSE